MENSLLYIFIYFTTSLYVCNGCTMEGVSQWLAPQHVYFKDTHLGIIISRSTSDIQEIIWTSFGEGLNGGPYLSLSLVDSVFTVTTTDVFKQYEQYETLLSITVGINFRCTGGTTRQLTFVFNINDTNNHIPEFTQPEKFYFPLALPVPPGFLVTGCEYLIVRDVDLTTQSIEFGIQENPYFEIVYHGRTQPKEFGAFIRTKTFIRSLPEVITFNISATDVDLTGDDPHTTLQEVNIVADNSFRLPDSPIFSEAFYKADYTIDHDLIPRKYISLREGYDDQVKFELQGEYAHHFTIVDNDNQISFQVKSHLPDDLSDSQILLVVKAERELTSGASATVVVYLPKAVNVLFESPIYEGKVEDNVLTAPNLVVTQGYEEIYEVKIINEYVSSYFSSRKQGNMIILSMEPLPPAVIEANNILNIQIVALANRNISASSIVVLEIIKDDYVTPVFEKKMYNGIYDSVTGLLLEPIRFLQGYDDTVVITLKGDHASYFEIVEQDIVFNLTASIPPEIWSEGNILITVEATKPRTVGANTAVLINLPADTPTDPPITFDKILYNGIIRHGSVTHEKISISGHTETNVEILGQYAELFEGNLSEGNVIINLRPSTVLPDTSHIALELRLDDARAVLLLNIQESDTPTDPTITFDKILYNGIIRHGSVTHEKISISGHTETNVEILGQYAELFEGNLSEGNVIINLRPSTVLPDTSHIALELRLDDARAVLLLNIQESETPQIPTVTFSSTSYVLRVDVNHSGSVGQVQASSDNGETIRYSLLIDDEHLRERLSINNDGELRLSAPATSGAYTFQVEATTLITHASANAPVYLTVEAVSDCESDVVVSPLIILDRDEEEPHRNLVVLNETKFEGCHFNLSNIWPKEQSWLYVDDDGLHTRSVDREDESIAFMALSQIQVELILRCQSDVPSRNKRSLSLKSIPDWLGPYEYGSNKWILTDTIPFNGRRSLVNLIVNDINDNVPIFVGKENEPIAFGYPVPDLQDIILPTALAKLKATDADIGENAALVYWSAESSLAVSQSTGFVYIRSDSSVQNNARFVVHATDQNGAGHTGNLEIMVKLLDRNRIVVLTIRDVFPEDEEQILSSVTLAVGYEVKSLRTVAISKSENTEAMRVTSDSSAISLQLFLYGLIEREPVETNRLIADINNGNIDTVNVANIISLEDHLDGNEICHIPGRDTGLLVATIVLGVLLFIIAVVVAVWFFLKWKKNDNNYDHFRESNSFTSENDSLGKPNAESVTKPRLNIEDLKRSEKRLQERLEVPVSNVSDDTSVSIDGPLEDIINIPTANSQMPIVIQTIDKLKDCAEESDDDEFGENKKSRRKSVVTFNENVEKIIHVEDNLDNNQIEDFEIYKF